MGGNRSFWWSEQLEFFFEVRESLECCGKIDMLHHHQIHGYNVKLSKKRLLFIDEKIGYLGTH